MDSPRDPNAAGPDELRLVVTAQGELPSQLPWRYAELLDPKSPDCVLAKTDLRPNGFMTWTFFGGDLDTTKPRTLDNVIFFFAMVPDHIRPMMSTLGDLDTGLIRRMNENHRGCLIGRKLLGSIRKSVGDRFSVTSVTFKGIDVDLEVVGELPDGRLGSSAIMNVSHLRQAFAKYERDTGRRHEQADRSLNIIWLEAADRQSVDRIIKQIEDSPGFADPPVRCETQAENTARLKQ